MSSGRHGEPRTVLVGRLTSASLTARRAAVIISLFTLALTVVAALAVHLLDREDFPSLGISAWWAVQTLTTVGYGDVVPQNSEGRIIGTIVMLGGISFVAVVTAAITASLVEAAGARASSSRAGEDALSPRLDEIIARMERLEERIDDSRSGPPGAGD
jgi:voltage-gated potassium channel Kch